ncbi:hypothetical protein FA13DRAFT_1739134 [Coprinellus micaceus]|uniref:Uncharacterized protein n=1 Tax=Coprinellus micaceus TaxID=71717 RepID=A0A4Y7SSG2_COPMI|nr:hypothetical protein FA13DRAFT_1739134 [Coprinellus micaceus]
MRQPMTADDGDSIMGPPTKMRLGICARQPVRASKGRRGVRRLVHAYIRARYGVLGRGEESDDRGDVVRLLSRFGPMSA